MNIIDKAFGSAVFMVPTWALIVLAGWLGGFALNYYGLPGDVAFMVTGTLVGLGGFAYAFVRSAKKS